MIYTDNLGVPNSNRRINANFSRVYSIRPGSQILWEPKRRAGLVISKGCRPRCLKRHDWLHADRSNYKWQNLIAAADRWKHWRCNNFRARWTDQVSVLRLEPACRLDEQLFAGLTWRQWWFCHWLACHVIACWKFDRFFAMVSLGSSRNKFWQLRLLTIRLLVSLTMTAEILCCQH